MSRSSATGIPGTFVPSSELIQLAFASPGKLKGAEWIDAYAWAESSVRNAVLGLLHTLSSEGSRVLVVDGRIDSGLLQPLLCRIALRPDAVDAFLAQLTMELLEGACAGAIAGPGWRLVACPPGHAALVPSSAAFRTSTTFRTAVERFPLGRRMRR